VKWGVLLKLANLRGASGIVQVAYYRPETINIDRDMYPMPDAVIEHFSRNVMDITRLSSSSVQIQVLNSMWSAEGRASGEYMHNLEAELAQIAKPSIIFLDPDTGLEPPKSKRKLEHVLESELKQIWTDMVRKNDLLVFYQHKTDRKKGESWIKPKKEQFERALGLSPGAAKMARGAATSDVVFFFAQKS
jgi:hypothetical protein